MIRRFNWVSSSDIIFYTVREPSVQMAYHEDSVSRRLPGYPFEDIRVIRFCSPDIIPCGPKRDDRSGYEDMGSKSTTINSDYETGGYFAQGSSQGTQNRAQDTRGQADGKVNLTFVPFFEHKIHRAGGVAQYRYYKYDDKPTMSSPETTVVLSKFVDDVLCHVQS